MATGKAALIDIEGLNERFKDKSIIILNHPKAGTQCRFVKMVKDQFFNTATMIVQDDIGVQYQLKHDQVFVIEHSFPLK